MRHHDAEHDGRQNTKTLVVHEHEVPAVVSKLKEEGYTANAEPQQRGCVPLWKIYAERLNGQGTQEP
jgi:hypothetical protein